MSEFQKRILEALAQPASETIKITIPSDHPVGIRLKKLFDLYATSSQTAVGITVQHRREDPAAVSLAIRELRQAVVETGGDPTPLDNLHTEPDPMAFVLKNIGSLLENIT